MYENGETTEVLKQVRGTQRDLTVLQTGRLSRVEKPQQQPSEESVAVEPMPARIERELEVALGLVDHPSRRCRVEYSQD